MMTMMTEVVQQKVLPRRKTAGKLYREQGKLPAVRRTAASRIRAAFRGLKQKWNAWLRITGLSRRTEKSLLRRAMRKRIAAKIFYLCGACIFLAVFLYSLAGIALPRLRAQGLRLSMPAGSEITAMLSAYVGPLSLDFSREEPNAPDSVRFESLSLRGRHILSGETLSEIARQAGLNLDTLISFNRIKDARRVPVGAELKLPNQNGILYTVRRGDSLSSIAHQYSVSTDALADVNNLESATIHPGQELFIPGARMKQFELKKILGELFIYPASGRLTSSFGMRNDPFTGVRRFHNGIDLAAPPGTPIYAAMAGKIAKVGVHPTYGKYIIISHPSGYQTWYAHLQRPLAQQGKNVAQGELIGEMGSTGYSTGPHLHFSVFKDGAPVDPLQFLR
jgi:murein DD-endopeptidase MepM/ murein hydrolase activator NlpD